MGPWRVVVSLAVVAGLGLGAVGARASQAATPGAAPCTAAALGAAFTGPMALASMQRLGCEGGWAFAWATVGSGQAEVGVTEVLEYDPTSSAWSFADRATVCVPGVLPDQVYRLGCFSN